MATNGVYGLSGSGIDVDAMVQKLISARKLGYASLYQQQQRLQWEKADYNTLYTDIRSYRDTVFNYKLQGTLNPRQVTSGNDQIATATASADAVNVTHSLLVSQLADGVKQASTAAITPQGADKTSIASQLYGGAATTPINITLKNGSQSATITVDPSKSIFELVSQINNTNTNIKASYDSTLDRMFLYSTNSGSASGISFDGSNAAGLSLLTDKLKLNIAGSAGTQTSSAALLTTGGQPLNSSAALGTQFTDLSGTFTLQLTNSNDPTHPQTISINPAVNTLDDVLGAITAGGKATASYDAGTGKLTLTPTGDGTLSFSGTDAQGLSFLTNDLKLSATAQQGQDAKVNLDGVDITQATNTFAVAGVTYTLKGVSSQATSMTVSLNTDQVVKAVQDFVDSYNKMLKEVNAKLDEPFYRDYAPLTDDQKKDMKDADITAWTDKAKSGLLRNDPTLQNLVYGMRNGVISPVSGLTGKYTTLSSIGVTTGDYSEGGTLHLDESKLRQALTDDPDIVNKLFATTGTTSSTSGIASRLYDSLNTTMDQLYAKAGTAETSGYDTTSALAIDLQDYSERISRAEDDLQSMQDRYYAEFDAMETAINQMNSQSQWLSQQLGTSN